jgi:hypothetical protein
MAFTLASGSCTSFCHLHLDLNVTSSVVLELCESDLHRGFEAGGKGKW